MLLNCGVGEDSVSPLDSKKIKQVNPKGNQSWIFMAGLMLKLKLQYFGHLMRRASTLEKVLMLGKIEGRRRRGQQKMRWLDGIDSTDMSLSKLQERVKDREAWHVAVQGVTKNQTWSSDWTTTQEHWPLSGSAKGQERALPGASLQNQHCRLLTVTWWNGFWTSELQDCQTFLLSLDFPEDPVVKTPCFHCRGHEFPPWLGD